MATIGTFTRSGEEFTGVVKTLTLHFKAQIKLAAKDSDKAPDFRIFTGATELGAAWKKTSNGGREYLSVKLDDPSFSAPVYASLPAGGARSVAGEQEVRAGFRDGFEKAGERLSPARRGDPRCRTRLPAPAVTTGRTCTRKLPIRSSPSWRPGASPGFSLGARRWRRPHSACRRTPRPDAPIPGSTSSFYGQPLASAAFLGQSWLTFRQALGLGGHAQKGEKGTTVVYADRFIPDEARRRAEEDGDEPQMIPFLKRFTVFNTDQCVDLPETLSTAPAPVPGGLILPAEALIAATGADFRIGGDRAFYSPSHDFVQVPRPESFFEPLNWHRTALHELGHWTGHVSRLARDMSGSFGTKSYGQEELCAEMASAFVCASLGIVPTVRHADYLGAWLDILREDNRAVIRAASAASKAADYLLAFLPETTLPVEAIAADAQP